jgi:hypothetical protein
LPVGSYGCETWSLTLREEYGLKVFEKRALRRIFGPKRGEIIRIWRKLHNEELHNLYSSPNIIRIINPLANQLMLFGKISLFIVRTIGNIQILCGQYAEFWYVISMVHMVTTLL